MVFYKFIFNDIDFKCLFYYLINLGNRLSLSMFVVVYLVCFNFYCGYLGCDIIYLVKMGKLDCWGMLFREFMCKILLEIYICICYVFVYVIWFYVYYVDCLIILRVKNGIGGL